MDMSSKAIKWFTVLSVVITAGVVSGATILAPAPTQARSTKLIADLVSSLHYSRPGLDDELSSAMLDRYVETLDPNKHFFLSVDIAAFEKYRHYLDDAFRGSDISPAFEIYNVYKLRVEERIQHALKLLKWEHDLTVNEEYHVDYEEEPWLSGSSQMDDLWRRRVKNDILNLHLSGKESEEITETLTKRYERILRRVNQQTTNDIYQVFVNSYTNSIDPHTTYFSPHNSENFNINMRLSLEGIGAALRTRNEHTVVQKVIPGGPAAFSGQLKARDRIIGVAQGQDKMIDVIGWRLQDVVELIRGPKNSVVRLLLLPYSAGVDGPTREITLVRDRIKLEEQSAKSSIIEIPGDSMMVRVGVIDLPTFYLDFEARARGDADYRSTTKDVKKLIRELQRQEFDGLLIDLRDNGGGSLAEATELTGLFIPQGPVVQVRGTRGGIDINEDPDPAVIYDGPLVVLVNQGSASASEIFAGAMQDYGRAIVVGEPTFGKGTVQTLVDLNNYGRNVEDLGQLKVTVAQFFRINGESTQHRGVRPDIIFPTANIENDHGERSLDNALPWARVRPASFTRMSSDRFNMEYLRGQHKSRIAEDAGFRYLMTLSNELRRAQDKKVVSLVEKIRRQERDEIQQRNLELENLFRESRGMARLTQEDKDEEEDDFIEEDDAPVLKIKLEEAAHILADYIGMLRGQYAAHPNLGKL